MFFYNFPAYFQNTFSLKHLWRAASEGKVGLEWIDDKHNKLMPLTSPQAIFLNIEALLISRLIAEIEYVLVCWVPQVQLEKGFLKCQFLK